MSYLFKTLQEILILILEQIKTMHRVIRHFFWNHGAFDAPSQRLHQRLGHINRTLHADIEKPTSLEKNINNLQKINFSFYAKKIKFCWKNLHLIVGTTPYCDTQQTIHNTTNNTQHKIHSWVHNFLCNICWPR